MNTRLIQRCIMLLIPLTLCLYGVDTIKETPIPQTAYGSLSKYYMLETRKNDTNYSIVFESVTANTLLFIRSEINCSTRSIRMMGSSPRSVKDIANNPSDWLSHPRIGTIEFDLITFVCK
ncbi:MAG: hypothetical protein PHN18_11515 [Sulfurospirillaceae bacterium]|nr:hypothetical protein [Sulfurospirillaceae bacterium]MDD2826472.1 hypothetical protein [Sulfurospirillaceae bacterium]